MIKRTIFAGSGGQGVLMMGYVYAVAIMKQGMHVTYLPSYGAEVRGGTANCTVVISDDEIASPVASSPDFAIVMNKPSMVKYQGLLSDGGLLVINSNLVDASPSRNEIEVIKIPANDIAMELGDARAMNMVMLGAFAAKTGIISTDSIMYGLSEIIKGKNDRVMKLNKAGLERGAAFVKQPVGQSPTGS
ncbi:MAG: 2-oxoacid:acceptor oxidoreductase family protein [Deltaproteobacteria bacterium]|nr:2-oxoacid:acceptor oxidoreductase family protein [Deltaproteobacteria bacterium]